MSAIDLSSKDESQLYPGTIMDEKLETATDRKLRGGYYTPNEIAMFIAQWVIQKDSKLVLEPSCGDGQFIEASINQFSNLGVEKTSITSKIIGVEINANEARKASIRFTKCLQSNGNLKTNDFFAECNNWLAEGATFDGILGNPPFIRYQDFPEEYRTRALDIMRKARLKPNKLMNIWIPFVVGSTLLLKEKGRIGFVLPAELFQVNYAAEIRKFLSDSYSKIILITFNKLVFDGVQQEVVIFLGEKNGRKNHGINIIEVNDISNLKTLNLENLTENLKVLDHSTEKWTQYFLDEKEIELIRKIRKNPAVKQTGDYLRVDVGVVTGQNKFFVLNQNQVLTYNLSGYTTKIFSKSAQLKGVTASQADFENSINSDYQNFLLTTPDIDYTELPAAAQSYIGLGEKNQFNLGYKCKIRKRWWVVPSVWIPDAFMLRQVNAFPKLILNDCQATVTDTVHRVRFVDISKRKLIVSAFLNSLTLAFSEITGRSYGGGVLTFEPSEAEKLPLPLTGAEKLDIGQIDKLIRAGEIEKVLDLTDLVLLRDGLNLSESDVRMLRGIWKKLRNRRLNRKN